MEMRLTVQLLYAFLFTGAGFMWAFALCRLAGRRPLLGAVLGTLYLLTAAGASALALVLIWRLG